jgi:hypothetical protein
MSYAAWMRKPTASQSVCMISHLISMKLKPKNIGEETFSGKHPESAEPLQVLHQRWWA